MSSLPADFDMKKISDRKYKGEDFNIDPNLVKEPFNNRKCTDVLMGIFFFAFLCLMAFMTGYGYVNGQPDMLLAPVDKNGDICGYTEGFQNYPYLYIYDITGALDYPYDLTGMTTCVTECPTTMDQTLDCENQAMCDRSSYTRYTTSEFLGYCVPNKDSLPTSLQESFTSAADSFMNSAGGAPIYDLYKARWVLFASVFIGIFYAFIYIKFMDYCALQCAWVSVITVGLALIGGGFLCWFVRDDMLTNHSVADDSDLPTYLFWSAIVFWIVSALYVLCLWCNINSLRVAIRVIETAADFFADTKRVALVPVLFFIVAVTTTFVWLYGYICVTSLGEITSTPMLATFQSKNVEYGTAVSNMLWIMVFGFFWIMAFILSMNEFVIIVSAASWYFSDKTIPDDDGIAGDSEVWKGFAWIFQYHFGSLALGSLLIAIVWIIRAIFEYVAEKVQDAAGENGFTKCLLCCVRCCLDCFDRFMRYITRNAYIYMAISSESFCSSALNAFILVLKNSAKFAFVEGFADVFMFLAKICISVFTTATGIICMKFFLTATPVSSPIIPALCMLAISFIVAGIFVSIFDTGANTILQCYLIDMDVCKQNNLEPKHIPETLKRFLDDHSEGRLSSGNAELNANLIQ
jgi:solute carrier family 44 (choline transporter-like protein), member 2/4/5